MPSVVDRLWPSLVLPPWHLKLMHLDFPQEQYVEITKDDPESTTIQYFECTYLLSLE